MIEVMPPEMLTHYIIRVIGIENDIERGIRSCENILGKVDVSWEGKSAEELKQKLEEFICEFSKIQEDLICAKQMLRSITTV